jgi:hypothetical protein
MQYRILWGCKVLRPYRERFIQSELKSISPLMHSFRRGDFLGDRSSEKSTCDRPIQQRKNRAIAFSLAMVAIAFVRRLAPYQIWTGDCKRHRKLASIIS